jgi:hypothetical protein
MRGMRLRGSSCMERHTFHFRFFQFSQQPMLNLA